MNPTRARGIRPLILLTMSVLCSCSGSGGTAESNLPSFSDAVEAGMTNAREPSPGLVTGGQPTPAQLQALVAAGYTRFVSLRPADEEGAGWEEEIESEGITFARLPVAGASGLTRENVEALDRLLDDAGSTPTVLYCASGNRAGALLALRAFWMEGASAEEALALGRSAGLTRLESAVTPLLRDDGHGDDTPGG